jgi:hypothetical protein
MGFSKHWQNHPPRDASILPMFGKMRPDLPNIGKSTFDGLTVGHVGGCAILARGRVAIYCDRNLARSHEGTENATLKTIETRLRRTLKRGFWSRKGRKERKEKRRKSPFFP